MHADSLGARLRRIGALLLIAMVACGGGDKTSTASRPSPSPSTAHPKYQCNVKPLERYLDRQRSHFLKLQRKVSVSNAILLGTELSIFHSTLDKLVSKTVRSQTHGGQAYGDECLLLIAEARENIGNLTVGVDGDEERALAEIYQKLLIYYPGSAHTLDAQNWLTQHGYPIPSPTGS